MVVARAIVQEELEYARRKTKVTARRQKMLSLKAYTVVFGVCLALFGANAYLHGLVAASSARIEALAGRLNTVARETAELELEVAYLSSYPRIAREAETQLAMRSPAPGEYRFVAIAPPPRQRIAATAPLAEPTGLVASLGGWLRTFGRTEACAR
ncbi:MAG: hypothetical protein ACM3ZC_09115 [Bacteroidota bacterium]